MHYVFKLKNNCLNNRDFNIAQKNMIRIILIIEQLYFNAIENTILLLQTG